MAVHPRDYAGLGHIASGIVHRLTRSTRMLLAVCVAVITAGSLCLAAKADIPMSACIRVVLEENGKPIDQLG